MLLGAGAVEGVEVAGGDGAGAEDDGGVVVGDAAGELGADLRAVRTLLSARRSHGKPRVHGARREVRGMRHEGDAGGHALRVGEEGWEREGVGVAAWRAPAGHWEIAAASKQLGVAIARCFATTHSGAP